MQVGKGLKRATGRDERDQHHLGTLNFERLRTKRSRATGSVIASWSGRSSTCSSPIKERPFRLPRRRCVRVRVLSSWALGYGLLSSDQPGAKYLPRYRLLANHIDIDGVVSGSECFSKWKFLVQGVLLQRKMLIADRVSPPNIIYRQHDEGQIKIPSGVIGNFNRSVDSLAIHLRLSLPLRSQWEIAAEHNVLLGLFGRTAVVRNQNRKFELANFLQNTG